MILHCLPIFERIARMHTFMNMTLIDIIKSDPANIALAGLIILSAFGLVILEVFKEDDDV